MDDSERQQRRINETFARLSAQVLAMRVIVTAQLAGVPLADGGAAAVAALIPEDAHMADEVRALTLSIISEIMSDQERLRSASAGKSN